MKLSIKRHQESLSNTNIYITSQEKELKYLQDNINRLKSNRDFRCMQINEAIRTKKIGFDAEGYMAKRR